MYQFLHNFWDPIIAVDLICEMKKDDGECGEESKSIQSRESFRRLRIRFD